MLALGPQHLARAIVVAAVGALALSCTPATHVVAAWKDPQIDRATVARPLVVFQHPSEALRRSVEDALVERIPGAVAAYTLLPNEEIFDVDKVRARVKGFDTVIVTRLVDVRQQVDVVPGMPRPTYDPLWGAWSYGWADVASPAYLDETTIVTLESFVYSLDPRLGAGEGELIWTSRSETFDPRSFEGLAKSVARASVKAMEKDGFIVGVADEP